MKSYFTASICLFVLAVAVYCAQAEQEHQQQHQAQHQLTNEEYKSRLVQLLSDLDTAESNEDNLSDEESGADVDKRMAYRYGKRMSYRYGKRSAMPYRFGKRGNGFYPSAQHILDYIKMHEANDDSSLDLNKRMSYRYGRSFD